MDATNGGTPQAGGNLSGELTRQYAIKRLQQQQRAVSAPQRPGKPVAPPTTEVKPRRF
jgi:hypothetical protein